MPVKLSQGALPQMLLRGSNVVTRRKVRNDLLANPTTVEDSSLGVGETPFQVGHDTIVGGLLGEIVRILQV